VRVFSNVMNTHAPLIVVRARVGPRPVYSATNRTAPFEMSAAICPRDDASRVDSDIEKAVLAFLVMAWRELEEDGEEPWREPVPAEACLPGKSAPS